MARLTETQILSRLLLQRFSEEAQLDGGSGQYFACILRDNGDLMKHNPGSPNLSPDQLLWAGRALKLLNTELHHDGAWVIVFTLPKPPFKNHVLEADPPHWEYGSYRVIWLDQDGDPQFTMEWIEGEGEMVVFEDVVDAGPVAFLKSAESAWRMAAQARAALDLKDGQTHKRALGEAPPSTTVH